MSNSTWIWNRIASCWKIRFLSCVLKTSSIYILFLVYILHFCTYCLTISSAKTFLECRTNRMWLFTGIYDRRKGEKAFLSFQFYVKFWGELSILNKVGLKQWEYKKMLSIANVTHYISYCAAGRDTKNW